MPLWTRSWKQAHLFHNNAYCFGVPEETARKNLWKKLCGSRPVAIVYNVKLILGLLSASNSFSNSSFEYEYLAGCLLEAFQQVWPESICTEHNTVWRWSLSSFWYECFGITLLYQLQRCLGAVAQGPVGPQHPLQHSHHQPSGLVRLLK